MKPVGFVDKFKAGDKWIRTIHGKDQPFTVEYFGPSPVGQHHELIISLDDGSRLILAHPYSMKTLQAARKVT